MSTEKLRTLADHRQVFFQRDVQHFGGVIVPRLSDQRDAGRLGRHQRFHAGVILGLHRFASCHAKRANLGRAEILFADLLKESDVLLVRQRVSPFDEIDSDFGKPAGNVQLVLQRKANPFALRTVAQSRVVDLDRFQIHRNSGLLSAAWRRLARPRGVRIRKNPRTLGGLGGEMSLWNTDSSHPKSSPAANISPASSQAANADDADNDRNLGRISHVFSRWESGFTRQDDLQAISCQLRVSSLQSAHPLCPGRWCCD